MIILAEAQYNLARC